MRFDVITLFPRMFDAVLGESIVGKARERGLVEVRMVNPRDFSADRHRKVDDRSYGGGPGMVMMAEPLYQAILTVRGRKGAAGKSAAGKGARRAHGRAARGCWVVHLSPQGRRFDASVAAELAGKGRIALVCGHYEGLDERLRPAFDDEISLGDFVLTGGEIAAMAVVDSVTRLVPGVLSREAVRAESFGSRGEGECLLDYPHYTRPRVWRGKRVPAVLLSGDHERISAWRRRAAAAATRRKRPDLMG